ncbi:hypothetical protein [Nostoc sp.]
MPCSEILVFIHLLTQDYRFVDPERHQTLENFVFSIREWLAWLEQG